MTNISNKYPNTSELQDVINEYIKDGNLLYFLRGKGIYHFNISHRDSSQLSSRLFFDEEEIDKLRHFAYRNNSNSLLSGFKLVSKAQFNLEEIYTSIREKETLKSLGYTLKPLAKIDDNIFSGKIEYRRKRPGKTEFLKYEIHVIDFRMQSLSENEWQVEIDGDNSSDCMVIQQMFEMAMQGRNIVLDDIKLENLSVDKTISFFDRLAKEGLDNNWKINDILRITLRKSREKLKETDNEEDSSNHTDKKDEETKVLSQEDLSGISQAILEGKNLRENQFVHLAEKGGYIFSSMTYQFVNTKGDRTVILRAEFKGSPKIFEVSLEYYSDSSKNNADESVLTISDEMNYMFRTTFWNSAKRIYNELLKGIK